jgi:protein-S-isoprenylcysteine O-methyltransferase Ste14
MNDKKSIRPGSVALMLFFIVIIPMLPLIISWHWNWWEAWIFAGLNIVGFAVSRLLAARKHPDLIIERAKYMNHDDTKSFDKILSPLVGLGGGVIPLIAGLDELLGWSPAYGLPIKIVSIMMILSGYVLASYALIVNRFFSGTVRIQTERGHHVISSGPYSFVRHPGYAGSLITFPFIPFLLDSLWAFIPSVFIIIALVCRTYLEDKTLQNELPGYIDYTKKVRFRLVPGVW